MNKVYAITLYEVGGWGTYYLMIGAESVEHATSLALLFNQNYIPSTRHPLCHPVLHLYSDAIGIVYISFHSN